MVNPVFGPGCAGQGHRISALQHPHVLSASLALPGTGLQGASASDAAPGLGLCVKALDGAVDRWPRHVEGPSDSTHRFAAVE